MGQRGRKITIAQNSDGKLNYSFFLVAINRNPLQDNNAYDREDENVLEVSLCIRE